MTIRVHATDADAALPFDEVYRRHADSVYRFCLSQVGNRNDAEDIAADVFVAGLAAYDRVRPDVDGVLAWLLRIAKNRVIGAHRRHRRRRAILDRFFGGGDRARAGVTEVETTVLMRADLRVLLDRMGRLGERDRLLVGLRVAAGLSYVDIAAMTGMSQRAATVATGRALDRLRRLCGEEP